MKSLNENWFAITLTAVIFGLLGFLIGRQNTHHQCPMMMDGPGMHINKMKGHDVFMWKSDEEMPFGMPGDIDIMIDTLHHASGKKVKVVLKKEE